MKRWQYIASCVCAAIFILGLSVCLHVGWDKFLHGQWSKSINDWDASLPKLSYGHEPNVLYFTHVTPDGSKIDLDYEGKRWKRVIFLDFDGYVIGDFTRSTEE